MNPSELRRVLEQQRNLLVNLMNHEPDHTRRQLLSQVIDGLDMTIHSLDRLMRHERSS